MTIDSKNWTSQPTSGARLVLGLDAPVRPLGHPAGSVPINASPAHPTTTN